MDDHDSPPPEAPDFWACRCARISKELLLLGLVSAFIVQTCLVYSDHHDTVVLSGAQIEGRRIWHRENCQTCHQLHGFGGFLGPDLTNATARVERSQLDELLTFGSGQMPAFHLPPDEIDAVYSYLSAMNETGRGQARNPNLTLAAVLVAPAVERGGASEAGASEVGVSEGAASGGGVSEGGASGGGGAATPAEALAQVIDECGDEAVAHGFQLFRTRACLSCHVLFGRSSIGAPDLSVSGMRLAPGEIDLVLEAGRPPRMPPPVLSAAERADVRKFILFKAAHRKETLGRVTPERQSFWSSLPWWEYQ